MHKAKPNERRIIRVQYYCGSLWWWCSQLVVWQDHYTAVLTMRRHVYLGMLIQEVVPAHLTRLWGPASGPGPRNTPSQWARLNSIKWAVGQWSLMTNYGLSRYRATNTRSSPKYLQLRQSFRYFVEL